MNAQGVFEDFPQMRSQGFGHDEARDVIRGIDHAVTLAPPACAGGFLGFFLFTARDRLQAFHIRDGLFEDMAEDRDGDFRGEVILAQGFEPFADVIGYVQPVDHRVFAEQAPVVARDF
ncbi:hypothetical protein LOM8899_04371 [Flavimaricola marinus]|uniref:Uncharacterized protein n=1 Tax=Flavimaricola marinus TaxID=1819565 RepID=A0A238LMP1_9RHOB|nr:hypothetical protein LOM8899_04371 [Flavimaricola marinus]